jgi:hypothetical protein
MAASEHVVRQLGVDPGLSLISKADARQSIVADWRLTSATVRLRAERIMALAPLNHTLNNGFFLSQGFCISGFA